MAQPEQVIVHISNSGGQYNIHSTEPVGWEDFFRKALLANPLFLGIEIGQNLVEGIHFNFVIDE